MKRVLVTGAAGFIGYHVALALAERGDQVVGLDNFNSYYTPELKRRRAACLQEKGVAVVEGDINDQPTMRAVFLSLPCTHVVHLAAQAGVRYARHHPDAYIESNISGFVSLLELLKAYPDTTLTYASSSSVYGCNEKVPFAVTDRTDHPANLYAATKKANELLAYSYHHLYGIPMTGLRFFTVYGPWGRPDMAYYAFTEAILEGRPLSLFQEGKMARDFTYIDDVVRGTLAAVDRPSPYALFNLGGHHPVPLLTFIKILEQHLGREAQIELLPESAGEVKVTYADIQSAQEWLGFAPTVSLEEGLGRFVAWYQETQRAVPR